MTPSSEFRLLLCAQNPLKSVMIEAGIDQPEVQSVSRIAFAYTAEQVSTLLSGFNVLEIIRAHRFPFVVEKYVKYEYEIVPWFSSVPKNMFAALEKRLCWHMLITECVG